MKKRVCSIVSLVLTAAMLFSGCKSTNTTDLTKGVQAKTVQETADLKQSSAEITDFGIRLFQNSLEAGENTLISPLSVLCALSMTANGAKGDTLTQMEEVLGLSVEELNSSIYTYMAQLPEEKNYKLRPANSIWFTDAADFQAEQDFLQTNADYYGADIYEAPFDSGTVRDINAWVRENTDGMIPEILDEIPEDAVMYLINALAFEAKWQKVYEDYQVREGRFTLEDGTKQKAEFMYSGEDYYLEDEKATGFLKYYEDRAYAFVALLPNEGVSVAEYVDSLTGEHVQNLLANPISVDVNAAIPKFECEYDVELKDILTEMGMADAFDMVSADFSDLGHVQMGNIYISRILHKTFISVGEQGTRAGAVTMVEMDTGGAAPVEESKNVYLDRPFVYMLIDCENNLPFFIGTLMEVEG